MCRSGEGVSGRQRMKERCTLLRLRVVVVVMMVVVVVIKSGRRRRGEVRCSAVQCSAAQCGARQRKSSNSSQPGPSESRACGQPDSTLCQLQFFDPGIHVLGVNANPVPCTWNALWIFRMSLRYTIEHHCTPLPGGQSSVDDTCSSPASRLRLRSAAAPRPHNASARTTPAPARRSTRQPCADRDNAPSAVT